MNVLNLKLYCVFLILFSALYVHAQIQPHVGDFTATGSIKSQTKTFLYGDDHKMAAVTASALRYTSNHANISSLQFYTNENETLGSVVGQNGVFGLKDGSGNWIVTGSLIGGTGLNANGNRAITLFNNGKVRIGDVNVSPSGYKLYVEDGILAEKVRVALDGESDWADFVFEDEYKLMPLSEVEKFIQKNNHLPNVPSAEEMVESGLDVLESDAILLRKIEEAYLYILQQQEQLDELKKEIVNLRN